MRPDDPYRVGMIAAEVAVMTFVPDVGEAALLESDLICGAV